MKYYSGIKRDRNSFSIDFDYTSPEANDLTDNITLFQPILILKYICVQQCRQIYYYIVIVLKKKKKMLGDCGRTLLFYI